MHIDYDFGATAEQLKESADMLSASESVKHSECQSIILDDTQLNFT